MFGQNTVQQDVTTDPHIKETFGNVEKVSTCETEQKELSTDEVYALRKNALRAVDRAKAAAEKANAKVEDAEAEVKRLSGLLAKSLESEVTGL